MRKLTRPIFLGNVQIGGGAPVVVQSMAKTPTQDVERTVAQIRALEEAGCEVVRLAVPDQEAARALSRIRAQVNLPLVADIHFDHRLALAALEAGVEGLRLNPGNIGDRDKVEAVARRARQLQVPIRIGVNAGSLEPELLARYGGVTAEALVESACRHVRLLEAVDFDLIKISVKASDVPLTVAAYRLLSQRVDYPLHLGITEAGPGYRGLVKSAVGLGILLAEGIGDTIRVSLTADPCQEVAAAWEILKALKLRQRGIELISCPTCGRCEIDVIAIASEVERRLRKVTAPLKVAVMGCAVNGPGEAREADVGLAGGKGWGVIFCHGRPVKKVPAERLLEELLATIKAMGVEGID
ncbi:flavodoxin-dependent (E)-4-hydroxy-3-methylbut-2-enyl-diphosphate synthase [Desulfothermobacter acidiphilus]|uniref:flavodoxin-dependent (E)-4-hydroxy-3-methylbut-2-enyl-diphosphate synthase n=1 Tax=Desulfothermobacter acidiphilus TaxID=1938353 RepID=UPI003F8C528B